MNKEVSEEVSKILVRLDEILEYEEIKLEDLEDSFPNSSRVEILSDEVDSLRDAVDSLRGFVDR